MKNSNEKARSSVKAKKGRQTISLCMIVRNEEQMLPRCLSSAAGLVDEIIIVDTGSTDRTIEVANSYGAQVHIFSWNGDFSAARNHALLKASCPWVLVLDADDELIWQDCKKIELLAAGLDMYACSIINVLGTPLFYHRLSHPQPRLFKKSVISGYSGMIHEQLIYQEGVKIGLAPFKIIHHGYTKQVIDSREKSKRNIEILTKQLKAEPENPFVRYNLAVEKAQQGRLADACLELESLVHQGSAVGEGLFPELIRKHIFNLTTLEEYDKALTMVNLGRSRYPDYTDLVFAEAKIRYLTGDCFGALRLFKQCLEMGESPGHYCTNLGVGGCLSLHMIGDIYAAAGDYVAAVKHYVLALKSYQEDLTPLLNMATALAQGTGAADFSTEFKRYCQVPREYHGLIAQALLERGEHQAARSLLDSFSNLGFEDEYYLALVDFAKGDVQSCKIRLEALAKRANGENLRSIAAQLCICCWIAEDWEGAKQYLTNLEPDIQLFTVYSRVHSLLTGVTPKQAVTPTEPLALKDDFITVSYPMRQFFLYGKFALAIQVLHSVAWDNTDRIVQAAQMLLKLGLYQWAVEFLTRCDRWDNIEINFLYGKALLGCNRPGPAAKTFETLIAKQPGFLPAYSGIIWSKLALGCELLRPNPVGEFYEQKREHWLRTGYLI